MSEYPNKKVRRGRREEVGIAAPLNSALSPLMRQIRKFSALKACMEALPEEISGLAAPFELRQAPRRGQGMAAAEPGAPSVSTIFLYTASAAVEALIEQRQHDLLDRINAALPYPMVEELRCEQASLAKIDKQLNILALRPD